MRFSPLLDTVPDYPFRKVARFSREAQQRDGISVINARIGIPDKEAPQAVKAALAGGQRPEPPEFSYFFKLLSSRMVLISCSFSRPRLSCSHT